MPLTDTLLTAEYDAWHAGQLVDESGDAPWHRLVRDHLDLTKDVRHQRILEIGCGSGGFSCWLAGINPPPGFLAACDFSATALSQARALADSKNISVIEWSQADIHQIPYQDREFDTVVSCETIEHVGNPARAVGELARVLRPGGRLFLTTPNYLNMMGLYRGYLRLRGRRWTEGGQPICHFQTLPRVLRLLKRTGLHIRAVDGCGHYYPCPRRSPVRVQRLDRPKVMMRWFALHTLVIAEKS